MTTKTPSQDELAATVASCRALVECLDLIYPERSPNPSHSEREVWMAAGERNVVRKLLSLLERSKG